MIVVFENKQYGEIIGSSHAPYLNQLAQGGAELTGMKALTHPSQPNYFNLFSGATQGVTGDGCYTAQSMTAPNLGQELIAAGKSFASYNEGLPRRVPRPAPPAGTPRSTTPGSPSRTCR